MRQWGRLFVLMAAVLPTVMNSLDDAPPCSIDHTLSRRRRMEIGPGGESKEVHTCLHLLWTHMDAGISTHVHTERARGCASMCVCVVVAVGERVVCVYWLPRMLTAHWTEDDLLIGDSMEHIEEEDLLRGLFSLSAAETSWISSTSPHVLSWCSLQLEASLISTQYQTRLECFLPASLPHEWLPYCQILYGYCWQVTQSHWLVHGELTIAEGGAVMVAHILRVKSGLYFAALLWFYFLCCHFGQWNAHMHIKLYSSSKLWKSGNTTSFLQWNLMMRQVVNKPTV